MMLERPDISYLDMVKPTYLENWTPGLCSLSMAQIDIPLTVEQTKALIDVNGEYGTYQGHNVRIYQNLSDRVKYKLRAFPHGAFIRLGSRSPKDSWLALKQGSMKVGHEDPDPLRFLTDSSERVSDDLGLALREEYTPHLFIREWFNIPKWSEFRCFMKDRKLQGISQYYYFDGSFEEITSEPDYIEWAIGRFFHEMFLPACHLDDVVFDVFLKVRWKNNQRSTEVRLIEMNPYFELTDPCLFKWNEEISGFRYNQ